MHRESFAGIGYRIGERGNPDRDFQLTKGNGDLRRDSLIIDSFRRRAGNRVEEDRRGRAYRLVRAEFVDGGGAFGDMRVVQIDADVGRQ